MTISLRSTAIAAAFAVFATSASAVTTTPFATPLAPGDNTFGNATAAAGEDFANASLFFVASDDLLADISITVNPFLISPGGVPSNTITMGYSVDGGAVIPVPIQTVLLPIGAIGAAGLSLFVGMGETLAFFLNGTAGPSGNQVTFAVETLPALSLIHI